MRGHDYQGEGTAGVSSVSECRSKRVSRRLVRLGVAIYTSCHLFLRSGVVIVD